MKTQDFVIVGGGIAGLAIAYRLSLAGKKIHLLEERSSFGGNIQTVFQDGFILDGGPDSFVTTKPDGIAFCKELGLEDQMISTLANKANILQKGKLIAMPDGMMLGVPSQIWPMVKTRLLPWNVKIKMGLEWFAKKRSESTDESIASFMTRHFGQDCLDKLAAPLLGGIYAGDVEKLSINSTFPQLVSMENEYGSLIRAIVSRKKTMSPNHKPMSPFISFRNGMSTLTEVLADRIYSQGGEIHLESKVNSIQRTEQGFQVHVFNPQTPKSFFANSIILSTPSFVTSKLLKEILPSASEKLLKIPYVSTATIFLAYPKSSIPKDFNGLGLVVPKSEKRSILAATFVSNKWAFRAPEGHVLIRAFAGGSHNPSALDLSDDELIVRVRRELASICNIQDSPLFTKVFRHANSNPQPIVGHARNCTEIQETISTIPNLHILGSAYHGVGIPDCIRQANILADKIVNDQEEGQFPQKSP